MGVTARSWIACLLLCLPAVPAHAALVQLDGRDGTGWPAAGTGGMPGVPGSAELSRLSRPIPVQFSFAEAARTAGQRLDDAVDDDPIGAPRPRPRAFRPADDPVLVLDVPQSTGWMPLVGGLALVAYRIRRGNRRFRFRSAV